MSPARTSVSWSLRLSRTSQSASQCAMGVVSMHCSSSTNGVTASHWERLAESIATSSSHVKALMPCGVRAWRGSVQCVAVS